MFTPARHCELPPGASPGGSNPGATAAALRSLDCFVADAPHNDGFRPRYPVIALPPLPRRENLDPVALIHRRPLAQACRHELAIERGRDLGVAVVERVENLSERRGVDLARLAINKDGHRRTCNSRLTRLVIARSPRTARGGARLRASGPRRVCQTDVRPSRASRS